jgi:hypothetical protein
LVNLKVLCIDYIEDNEDNEDDVREENREKVRQDNQERTEDSQDYEVAELKHGWVYRSRVESTDQFTHPFTYICCPLTSFQIAHQYQEENH